MKRRLASVAVLLWLGVAWHATKEAAAHAAQGIGATRLSQNPLITVDSSASLGGNVNGPTVIRVPDWIDHPLGRYYMYFANHMGEFIRLAYADTATGPWRIYEPGVLHVRDTAFFRPQPDPKETLDDFYTHVASPEILIDPARRRFVMWFHGWWTNGERWPSDPVKAHAWATQNKYGQFTQVAESTDGIHFNVRAPISRVSYLRVFQYGGYFYGMSRLGQLSRSKDPLASFETGPNPFRDGPYARRVRHVAIVLRGSRLQVFFTAIADAPERVLMSSIDLTSDWTTWRATPAVEVLHPETHYECADMPNAPSEPGDVEERVRQIRDPFVFEEQGQTLLFYSTCGEQGIAAATLTLRDEQRPAAATPPPLTVIHQAPRKPGPGKPPLLVLLHGFGADENDLMPLAVRLDPRLAIASLRAPIRRPAGGYSWMTSNNSDADLDAARRMVLECIDQVVASTNADRHRVYLAGFSQGAMLTLAIALTEPKQIAGAAVLSGRLVTSVREHHARDEQLRGLPILVTHGTQDPQIPVRSAHDIRLLLRTLPVTLEYHEFDSGHNISDFNVSVLDSWLRKQLGKS